MPSLSYHLGELVVADIQIGQVMQLAKRLKGCQAIVGEQQCLHMLTVRYQLGVLQVCICDFQLLMHQVSTGCRPAQLRQATSNLRGATCSVEQSACVLPSVRM